LLYNSKKEREKSAKLQKHQSKNCYNLGGFHLPMKMRVIIAQVIIKISLR